MPDQAEQVCYDQTLISVGTQLSTGRTLPVARLGAAVNDAIGMSPTGICRHALKRPPWALSRPTGAGRKRTGRFGVWNCDKKTFVHWDCERWSSTNIDIAFIRLPTFRSDLLVAGFPPFLFVRKALNLRYLASAT